MGEPKISTTTYRMMINLRQLNSMGLIRLCNFQEKMRNRSCQGLMKTYNRYAILDIFAVLHQLWITFFSQNSGEVSKFYAEKTF